MGYSTRLKHIALLFACVFGMTIGGSVLAADGAKLFKTKTCFSCHGKDAKSPLLPVYPPLAGQNADYAFNQMKDIKSGARSGGQAMLMKGIIAQVSEEEMRIIADWLGGL